MDLIGVVLGGAGCIACGVQVRTAGVEYGSVRRLRRSGVRVTGEVTGTDRYRVFDVRRLQSRPIVRYTVDGRTHETAPANCAGELPQEAGLPLLVNPDEPLEVVAAERNDARRQLVVMTVLALACLATAVLSALL